ncbi:GntR family transcriptional regulator/MocR family aminotransferase [Paraburkholderia sp. GAS199]|uniref:MocR-like pyridoxine biosynthesis transcription factor PdxR n=1 Tax=Paraburkholderia sp. GAS199 TaxID=3035126 RepID=UPI003D26223A
MRRAKDIEIALAPRPEGVSLQQWLYDEIRGAILSGRFAPGSRLPATRDLAARYVISRGTVLGVFAQLTAEGYVSGAVGRGSFVATELPERRLTPARRKAPPRALTREATRTSADAHAEWSPAIPDLSARGRLLARTPFQVQGRAVPALAFRPSQPDLTAFPFALWSRLAARRTRRFRTDMLTDGEAQGYGPLREAIAEHVRTARGIACSGLNVVMLGSVQQALDLSARLLLDPGDTVLMEDPGYPGARFVFEAAGARIVGAPVDADGMDVNWARRHASHARIAYVTAGRQAPLGPPLALERRLALLAWAREKGALILEDDYDSEFRFAGRPLAALKSLDSDGHVIYCGTFSKLLFPALRIAYAIVPDRLVDPFVAALSLSARHVALDQQSILHAFIAEGHFGRHIRRMRLLYGERAQALEDALQRHLGGVLDTPGITTGLDTPAFLPLKTDDTLVAARAASAGIETRPLSYYAFERPVPPGLVLGFAAVDADAIGKGVVRLARVLDAMKLAR